MIYSVSVSNSAQSWFELIPNSIRQRQSHLKGH